MTTGAPIIDVTALIGRVISNAGISEIESQKSIIDAPKSKVLQNKIEWLLV